MPRFSSKFYDLLAASPLMFWYIVGFMGDLPKITSSLAALVRVPWQPIIIVGLLSTVFTTLFAGLMIFLLIVRRVAIAKTNGMVPRIVAFLGTYLCVILILLPQHPGSWHMQLVSLTCVLVGEVIAFYSLFWLGRSFSIMPEARELITGGPYSIVRHPLYVGEQIAVLGTLLQHLSMLSLAVYALQFSFQLLRMTSEEQVLRQTYSEYDAYSVRTARLLPFVY